MSRSDVELRLNRIIKILISGAVWAFVLLGLPFEWDEFVSIPKIRTG